jgi:septal ring factor EnvC (AmiA/AmiB activator)
VVSFRLMTDLTLEMLRTELAPLRAGLAEVRSEVADVRSQLADVRSQVADVRSQIGDLRAQLADLDGKVAPMRAQLDRLPLIRRSLTVLQQETRALRAAFNDFDRTSVTAGRDRGPACRRQQGSGRERRAANLPGDRRTPACGVARAATVSDWSKRGGFVRGRYPPVRRCGGGLRAVAFSERL